MSDVHEHRRVRYSIPHNDEGVWHYRIFAGRLSANSARPKAAPVEGFVTRKGDIAVAIRAIDDWLGKPKN